MNCKYYLFLVLILFSSCTTLSKKNYKVSEAYHHPDDLKKDIDYVFSTLIKNHPGVYWYISEEQLNFKIDSLKSTINEPLKTYDFYLKLAPIVTAINCGHTRLILVTKKLNKEERNIKKNEDKGLINKFTYALNNEKLYLRNGKKGDSVLLPGIEITAIENKSTVDIINNLKRYIPSDGFNITFKEALLNRNFGPWYSSIFKENDSLNMDIIYKGVNKNITVKKDFFIKKDTVNKQVSLNKPIKKVKNKLKYKGLDENKQPILDYKIIDSLSKIAYLKVKSFSFDHSNFDKFYKESFEEIKNFGIENLILDLRNNGGGSLKDSRNLFSYLTDKDFIYLQPVETNGRFLVTNGKFINKILSPVTWISNQILIKKSDHKYYANIKGTKTLKPATNNYKGNLFVITNGLSFSASTLLAANLKGINRAIFVGSEGGGGFNQCTAGRIPIIDLPVSGLKLRFGMYKLAPNTHSNIYGRGVFPDIKVETSIEDELKKKDPEMETILKLIKK